MLMRKQMNQGQILRERRVMRAFSNCMLYQLNTIWLFTLSDLKTIVFPSSIFGLVGAIAGPPITTEPLSLYFVLRRGPVVILWTWSTLLPFDINNQNHRDAITEDAVNKPWRPLPLKRISTTTAHYLMIGLYMTNTLVSYYLGALNQSVVLIVLGIWYNRLGGADRSCFEKNLINSLGYASFITGALAVALDSQSTGVTFGSLSVPWFATIATIIFTTVHAQDLADMEGDASRGRRTVPLVIGETPARLIIDMMVPFWSVLAPYGLKSSFRGYLGPIVLAAVICPRVYWFRTKRADDVTFILWNLWIMSIYAIPLSVAGAE